MSTDATEPSAPATTQASVANFTASALAASIEQSDLPVPQQVALLMQVAAKTRLAGHLCDAVELYGRASELLGEEFGEDADECGDCLLVYGQCLLEYTVSQSGILGKQAAEVEEQHSQLNQLSAADSSAVSEATATTMDVKCKGKGKLIQLDESDAEHSDDEDIVENESASAGDDGADEAEDDFAVAWEILDLARVIFSRESTPKSMDNLAEVYKLLGDTSLETENFDQAIQDYRETLRILGQILEKDDRRCAEAQYKLALALEYSGDRREALNQLESVKWSLRSRVLKLETKSALDSVNKEAVEPEVVELEELSAEIGVKIEDIKMILAGQEAAGSRLIESQPTLSTTSASTVNDTRPVNDLTSLVRQKPVKVTLADAPKLNESEERKRKAELNEVHEQEKKLKSL